MFLAFIANAQSSFSYSCTKDTLIECGPRCITLKAQIPNIKSLASNYVVNKISSNGCFKQPVAPGLPSTSVNFNMDDVYSPVIPLPFIFPFYGIIYDRLVIGVNGTVSFDETNAGLFAEWAINNNLPSSTYARAVIMLPFQDINIQETTSSGRQIKYDLIGVAPHRKWVLTFYKIPLYGCSSLIDNTYQLVLHEGTGIVEIFVNSRQVCAGWNSGRGIIGMQDYDRLHGIMAPGRSALGPAWGSIDMDESWRFTPSDGSPLLKKTELHTINGNFVANGDTVDAGNGNYNVSFNNVCIDSTTDYVVKSIYYNFLYFLDPSSWPPMDKDSLMLSTDTIHFIRAYQSQATVAYSLGTYCNTETMAQLPVVTDAGIGGTFLSQPPGLTINASNGAVTPLGSGTGLYTVTYTLNNPLDCTAPTATTTIRIVDNSTFAWTGAASSDWENAANWTCNNLPTSSSNVFIYDGTVVINSNVTVNSLTVAQGASLTVNPGINLTVLHP